MTVYIIAISDNGDETETFADLAGLRTWLDEYADVFGERFDKDHWEFYTIDGIVDVSEQQQWTLKEVPAPWRKL